MSEANGIEALVAEKQTELMAAVKAAAAPKNSNGKRGPAVLKPVDALAIYKTDYPPPEFVIEDLLPRRGLTLAAIRPKAGKSWLTLQLAVAVAFGELALGRFRVRNPGRVTYLALEEPAVRTHHRLREVVPNPDVRLPNIGSSTRRNR
jgi:hypothetical protein